MAKGLWQQCLLASLLVLFLAEAPAGAAAQAALPSTDPFEDLRDKLQTRCGPDVRE